MDINTLRQQLINNMVIIPHFIKTTSFIDHAVWNNMKYINDILMQLISDKIITDRKISVIVEQYYLEMGIVYDIYDDIESVNDYYSDVMEYILERSLEEERFEAATNIRNFITQYKKLYQF
jgi:hypothetical protein